jgi:asparagine synthase (glutamine-hydrolysing)
MFAFAIYDNTNKEVTIVRDRIGVKPLYFYQDDMCFAVASQVNTLQVLLHKDFQIDESALYGFFSLGYVAGQNSIYKNIKKVQPGAVIKLKLSSEIIFSQELFWDINKIEPAQIKIPNKEEALTELLEDAIKLRMVSDVEIGSFLSGGLDSSYVTKILQENNSNNKLKTFTIGFDASFDEAPHAKKVAKYIGTNHQTHYLKPDEIKDILFNYADYFDEPFSDDAAIPMLFLSRMSKKDVKVVISSDGGDEVFAGYSRYLKTLSANIKLNKIPFPILFITKYLSSFLFRVLPKRNKLSNSMWRLSHIIDRDKSRQLANILLYGDMIPTPELNKILTADVSKLYQHNYYETKKGLSPLKQLLSIDIKECLVNQMLVKVDKSTMGASIEGREPLLDHRLFEFMASCNDEDFIKNNETKYLFRKVIQEKFNNNDILNKPKMGFNTPIYSWLRDSFPDFVENEFKSINKNAIPYLNEVEVLKLWDEFKSGKAYYKSLIWRSLIYVLWYKKYILKN